MTTVAATVGGAIVLVADVDEREKTLRATPLANALPRTGTSEGRQLRRWLTQVLVTAKVVAAEADARGLTADGAPTEAALLPDVAARLELGSVAASALEDDLARALFVAVTEGVTVGEAEIADYHRRNPFRFAGRSPVVGGWHGRPVETALDDVRDQIGEHLLAVTRRREFRRWLDARREELVELAPGYEHPGDPRQPDNVTNTDGYTNTRVDSLRAAGLDSRARRRWHQDRRRPGRRRRHPDPSRATSHPRR